MLDTIPAELLREILAYVPHKNNLLALSRVSKKLRQFVFPQLFKMINFESDDEAYDFRSGSCPFFNCNSISEVPEVLGVVQELHIRAPLHRTELVTREWEFPHILQRMSQAKFREAQEQREWSWVQASRVLRETEEGLDLKDNSVLEHGEYGVLFLLRWIRRTVAALPHNQLTSFSWDLGTCLPFAILAENSYLASHRNSIRRISLTTQGQCFSQSSSLEKFTNLNELSWKGFLSGAEIDTLQAFLDLHHANLVRLELDFFHWLAAEATLYGETDDYGHENGLIDLIPTKDSDVHEAYFPNLQALSLSVTRLKGGWDRLIVTFNLHNLMELRIRNCSYTVDFLEYVAQSEITLQASKVELVIDEGDADRSMETIDFLSPFQNLEDLFLMFESGFDEMYSFERILRHQNTLRRLVLHRRQYRMTPDTPYDDECCDISFEGAEVDYLADLLCQINLVSAGLCGEPSRLQECFQSVASTIDSLELLHLRFTGKMERKPRFFREEAAFEREYHSAEQSRLVQEEAERNETAPPAVPRVYQETSESGLEHGWEEIQGRYWREDEDRELEAFADWAFGPDGFPSLRVLASGDFSYVKRFADSQTLWCRNSGGGNEGRAWRVVSESDFAENELIHENMDMLSACRVSPLIYEYGNGTNFPGIN